MGKIIHPTIKAPTRPTTKKIPTLTTLSKSTHGTKPESEESNPPFEDCPEEFAGFFIFLSPLCIVFRVA